MAFTETGLRQIVHEELAKAKRFGHLSHDVLASHTYDELAKMVQEHRSARASRALGHSLLFLGLACGFCVVVLALRQFQDNNPQQRRKLDKPIAVCIMLMGLSLAAAVFSTMH